MAKDGQGMNFETLAQGVLGRVVAFMPALHGDFLQGPSRAMSGIFTMKKSRKDCTGKFTPLGKTNR
jgi:hypothetical protein